MQAPIRHTGKDDVNPSFSSSTAALNSIATPIASSIDAAQSPFGIETTKSITFYGSTDATNDTSLLVTGSKTSQELSPITDIGNFKI